MLDIFGRLLVRRKATRMATQATADRFTSHRFRHEAWNSQPGFVLEFDVYAGELAAIEGDVHAAHAQFADVDAQVSRYIGRA